MGAKEGENRPCVITVVLLVNDVTYSKSFVIDPDCEDNKISEKRFEYCYNFMLPIMRAVMWDEKKLVSA